MPLRAVGVALVLSVVAFLAPVGLAGAAQADDPRTASVSGRVVLPEGVDPTTVLVEVLTRKSDTWTDVAERHLAGDGSFVFSDLMAGDYRFGITQLDGTLASGYYFPGAPAPFGAPGGDTILRLAAGERRDVEFTVPLGVSLSGTVTADSLVQLERFMVVAHRFSADGKVATGGRLAWTGEDGSWSHTQLWPGTYRVSVTHFSDATWPAYVGGESLETATDLVLAPGESRSGLDVATVRPGRIRGRVDLSALPEESWRCVSATAHHRTTRGWTHGQSTSLAADGSYEFTLMRSGAYRVGFHDSCHDTPDRVTAADQFFPDALEVGRAADVVVKEGLITFLDPVALAPAGHLVGRVSLQDRDVVTPAHGRRVTLYRQSSTGWQAVAEQVTDHAGDYFFRSVPAGDYRLGVGRGDKKVREIFHPSALTLAKARTFTIPVGWRPAALSLPDLTTWRRGAKVHATTVPKVAGRHRVGRVLRATRGKYAQEGTTVRYQWQVRSRGAKRDLARATTKRLRLKATHRGVRVRVRVVVTAPGHQRLVLRTPWSSPVAPRRS